jgi:hypothetical protein
MIDRQGLAHSPTRIAQGHRGGGQVTLSVDGTGVGRGVVDMLDTEFKRRSTTSKSTPRVDFRRVSVTGSQTTLKIPNRTNGYWSVPKLDFSHLSQSGWVAHRPSAQREAISRWLHTPLFAISATKPQAELRKGLLRGF